VVAQFLRALGRAVPDQPAERVALYRTLLAGRRVLVVLDDAVDGAQVRDLIPASPGCAVLATSRQRMPEVSGAHHVAPLEPLRHGDAVELFLRAAADSGIDLAGELAAVEQVAGLCGGLPLALRIAAMLRVHDHPRSTAELAGRLARQGPEALTFREQSVARTIGAGLDRLDEHARRLFLGLGLLRQPTFSPWTAAALLPEDGAAPDAALSELAASNMIEVTGPGTRYRFHDLTRDYAARRAAGGALPAADRAAMPGRAYQALLTLARRAHAALYGGDFEVIHSDVPDWDAPPALLALAADAPLAWFEQERENIRAAVSHCADLGLAATCWDLAVSAHEFYTVAGYHDDWHATHSTALEACRAAGDLRGEGIVLACLGQPALVASSTGPSGLPSLQRAVRLLGQCGDRHGEAIALRTLANALRRRGRLAEPIRLFRRALAGYDASGDTVGSWQARRFIGQAYLDLGRPADARRELEGALGIAVQLGTARLLAQTWYWAGQALLAAGDITGARARFADMLGLFAEPAGLGHAYAMHGLGDAARLDGDAGEAAACLALAARLARDGEDLNLEGRVALSAARLHEHSGQAGQAIDELTRAVACFISCQAAHLQVEALFRLAVLHQAAGRAGDARDAWSGIEDLYAELDVPAEDRMRRRPAGLEG
jgi:tetratricopeptide (TPR) repeat protein